MTYPDHPRQNTDRDLPRSVTLTERDLQDARRLLALLTEHDEGNLGSALPAVLFGSVHAEQERLREKARQILALRRKRSRRFSSALFSEPAWEMLLILYAADGAQRLTVSRLALLSGSSKGTAQRWMEYLQHKKLIGRDAHPTDKRVTFVELTEEGKQALSDYLSEATELRG